MSSVIIPKSVNEALDHPGWRQAMIAEMQALESNHTWELVPLPSGKKAVGCRWVYAIKVGPDWLQKGTLRFMALTIVTPSLPWPR